MTKEERVRKANNFKWCIDNNVSSFNRKKLSPSLKRAYQRFIDNTEFNTEETTYKPRILTDREIKENEEYWAHIDELMCLGNGAY